MAKSTLPRKSGKPEMPRPNFPRFPHANGHWAKKIRQNLYYFGRWDKDLKGKDALELYQDQRDDHYASRTPRADREGLTVEELVNRFLTAKLGRCDTARHSNAHRRGC